MPSYVPFAKEKFLLLMQATQRSEEFGEWARKWLGYPQLRKECDTVVVRCIPPSAWDRLLASIQHEIETGELAHQLDN